MRKIALLLSSALLLIAADGAAAQGADSVEALTPGHRAIAFSLPEGGGASFGFWKVVSPRRSNGVFLTVATDYSHSSADTVSSSNTHVALTLGPRGRRYLVSTGRVLPFAESGLDVGAAYLRTRFPDPDGIGGPLSSTRWDLLADVDAGAGAEWFPTQRVSLAVSTGFRLSFQRSHQEGTTNWNVALRTFTSALTGQFYF